MTRIACSLAGALAAAGAIFGTVPVVQAQVYYGYGAPPGYYYAYPRVRAYAPRGYWSDRGDPLHRYYIPGIAPNANNPTVAPFYMAPHVDDGLIYRRGRQ